MGGLQPRGGSRHGVRLQPPTCPLPLPLAPSPATRRPFSGGKLMHAHLCGRLPRDTLVAGYNPGVPVFMLSGDVATWFRRAARAARP